MTGREGLPEERFRKEELRPGAWSFVASILLFFVGAASGIFLVQPLLDAVSPNIPSRDNWFLVFATMLLIWLLLLPLTQYVLLRFVGGARPKLAWAALVPNVFLFFRAVGYRLEPGLSCWRVWWNRMPAGGSHFLWRG